MAEQAEYKARRRHQLATIALDPAVIADQVCDAVLRNRFYVITHPESLPAFEERAKRILAGDDPMQPTQ